MLDHGASAALWIITALMVIFPYSERTIHDWRNDMKSSKELRNTKEQGRIGYLVLYLMGAPVGLLLLLWVIFGNNLVTPG